MRESHCELIVGHRDLAPPDGHTQAPVVRDLDGRVLLEFDHGWWIHTATPPWCEQVPLACSEKLYVASRQRAVAPFGTDALRVGLLTQCPLTFL